MSKYLRQVTVTESFDGDTVKVALRPISFEHQMEIEDLMPEMLPENLSPELRKRRFPTDEDFHKWAADQTRQGHAMWLRLRTLMSDYITSMEGLVDAAGASVSKDEMLRDSYFISLVSKIFRAWWAAKAPARPEKPTSLSEGDSSESNQSPTSTTGATVG